MKVILTDRMPKSNGHYSQVIEHMGVLYFSGQLPIDPLTGKIPQGIEAQTRQVLANILLLLLESGSDKDKVLQMKIYLSDILLWDKVNAIYQEFFSDHKPVRSIVPTRPLHFGCLIEIEAMAVQIK